MPCMGDPAWDNPADERAFMASLRQVFERRSQNRAAEPDASIHEVWRAYRRELWPHLVHGRHAFSVRPPRPVWEPFDLAEMIAPTPVTTWRLRLIHSGGHPAYVVEGRETDDSEWIEVDAGLLRSMG